MLYHFITYPFLCFNILIIVVSSNPAVSENTHFFVSSLIASELILLAFCSFLQIYLEHFLFVPINFFAHILVHVHNGLFLHFFFLLIHYRVVSVHAHCFDWSFIPVQAGGIRNLLFFWPQNLIVHAIKFDFVILNTCMAWCCLPSDFCLKFIFSFCTYPLNFLML